jgi:hypothetical protein
MEQVTRFLKDVDLPKPLSRKWVHANCASLLTVLAEVTSMVPLTTWIAECEEVNVLRMYCYGVTDIACPCGLPGS